MDLSKASEVYDFYLEEIEKAKYIKRTGSPGNYKYVYPGDEKKGRSGKKVVEKPASKITNKQESEGEKKMDTKYTANYNFEKNGISYRAKISGQIIGSPEHDASVYHESNLNKGAKTYIINGVLSALSDNGEGFFINDKPIMTVEAKLLQSNANESFAVLVDDAIYPISVHTDFEITSDHSELLR